jgi:hypothetical protein
MAILIDSDLQFNGSRLLDLQDAIELQEPATLNQLINAVNNTSWKASVRFASTANINIASPGTSMDSGTLVLGDRILLKNQTTQTENLIYIFNSPTTPLTIAQDSNSFAELENAIVIVEEGTSNGGTKWRQTQLNGILGTNPLIWVPDGQATPDASETVKGSVEIATQTETNTGNSDTVVITPLKLANSPYAKKSISGDFGDGTNTSYTITHNYNTRDVSVTISEKSGTFRDVIMEVRKSLDSVTVIAALPVALNSRRITVSKL